MSSKITKIDSIKNMAVFRDFEWSSFVRDSGNNIAEFKKINIIYGRNYSGKTTLSRIFRALEIGSISEKYSSPEFQLSFDDGSIVSSYSLYDHNQIVRVFNEDFVRENLRFFVDDNQTIKSFAILGEDNTNLLEEIEKFETELGNEDEKSGLLGNLLEAEEKYKISQYNYNNKSSELNTKLRNKANKQGSGIKHNKLFGSPNYNITKIQQDLLTVTKDTYLPLSDDQVDNFQFLLKEEPKLEILESSSFNLQYSELASKAKDLIEKKIQISDPIQELLNDATLAEWVRTGRELHKKKRDTCAFCSSELPYDIWDKLDKHFNQESEELRQELERLLQSIEGEQSRVSDLLTINKSDFYSSFTNDLDTLSDTLTKLKQNYCKSLNSIYKQLEQRKENIFSPLEFIAPLSYEKELNSARVSFEQIRTNSNQLTNSLSNKQSNARQALLLHEIYKFKNDINYEDESDAIVALKKTMEEEEEIKDSLVEKVKAKRIQIDILKTQLKDESNGAERVNNYLNNYFGHQFLSLKAIEDPPGDSSSGYRFEIFRNDKKAFQLSQGECSLIAFCYFIAKLEDIETKGNQPIIWIDDPISSLDANHIFFVYSLINTMIVTPEDYEDRKELNKRDRFQQLFISTHNLDFLKYLKRLPGALNKKNIPIFYHFQNRSS